MPLDARRWPEKFGPYLRVIAELHLRGQWQLRGKISPSDVVQETLTRGLEKIEQFRGSTEEEERGWLRQILANLIRNAVRDLGAQKRDAAREVSLEAFEQSSMRLRDWLEARDLTPATRAQREEIVERLGRALTDLPDAEREAVVLYYLQGVAVRDIANKLGQGEYVVARTIRRGLQMLRPLLHEFG